MTRRIAITGLLAAGLLLAGCQQWLWQAGIPWTGSEARVVTFSERGRYLDARLQAPAFGELRMLFPDDAACQAILQQHYEVRYREVGPRGQIAVDGLECTAVGIGSFDVWRKRQPRDFPSEPLPRAQATHEFVYHDEEVFLTRGRFPLAAEIGFTGATDLVAMLPASAPCAAVVREGVSTMQYDPQREPVFRLLREGEDCPILAFAIP